MPAQTVIDSLEFARAAQELRGSIPVTTLTRLRDCLSDTGGAVDFAVTGGRDEARRPVLTIEISGDLRLQCQRCLGALDYPLHLSSTLLLAHPGEDVSANAEDPEAPDCIEASAELNVAALVEDEILLSLPFAPRHPEKTCRRVPGMEREDGKVSPFSRLAELRQLRQKQ
ncbi:MAG TPA: YceD family protein [Burkholderiales bacterium]|nr:YceD family protein [Burkholderiales bacterium]